MRISERRDPSPSPKNVICVLLDTLRRDNLGAYGESPYDTPNLDAFADRAVRFNNHFAGSLPCMPARHDLACGTYDFLWKPWGSIESWEAPLPRRLRDSGVVTSLVTDHHHLFAAGGENYHVDYLGWEYLRGHEGDPWVTEPFDTSIGTPTVPDRLFTYARNSLRFEEEEDYPGPKTMAAAVSWLDANAGEHDRFFLMVDEFDPHEPFDTPDPYASMYDPEWNADPLVWPPYAVQQVAERRAHQLRAQYAGKIRMIDTWFGRLIDAIDRHELWDDTLIVVLTDHGIYLGEHDTWGKPSAPVRRPLAHLPMLIAAPGIAPSTIDTLTTNVDVHATILDAFGLQPGEACQGTTLLPLLRGETRSVREYALGGYFGHRPFVTDGRIAYQRGWQRTDVPLVVHSNRWSGPAFSPLPPVDDRAELGPFMPHTDWPVIRQPIDRPPPGDINVSYLFDMIDDPAEHENRAGEDAVVRHGDEMLRAALRDASAPEDLYLRLGLYR